MTEPESGSGAFSMKSTGEKTEGGYILNDRKILSAWHRWPISAPLRG